MYDLIVVEREDRKTKSPQNFPLDSWICIAICIELNESKWQEFKNAHLSPHFWRSDAGLAGRGRGAFLLTDKARVRSEMAGIGAGLGAALGGGGVPGRVGGGGAAMMGGGMAETGLSPPIPVAHIPAALYGMALDEESQQRAKGLFARLDAVPCLSAPACSDVALLRPLAATALPVLAPAVLCPISDLSPANRTAMVC